MRISDWSSDVCSSDLYGDVHILELHRQRIGPAILLAFDRRQFPAARALPPRPRMLPQRRRPGALQGRGRIMPGTLGRSVRLPPPRFPVAVIPRCPAAAGLLDPASNGEEIRNPPDPHMVCE